jgi:hypothetical protein
MTNRQLDVLDESFLSEIFTTQDESFRCLHALTKFARQTSEPFLVTGGLAIQWHLLRHGLHIERRPFNDIDIVIHDPSRPPSSLTQQFLLAHYHPFRRRGKILMQLADEASRSRIDLLTPYSLSITDRAQPVAIAGKNCGIVATVDLTARLLCILFQVVDGKTVDPKYYESFKRLASITDMEGVATIWREYKDEWHPEDVFAAVTKVHEAVGTNGHLLQPDVYSQAITEVCQRCHSSEAFPLAPAAKIHQFWGYV